MTEQNKFREFDLELHDNVIEELKITNPDEPVRKKYHAIEYAAFEQTQEKIKKLEKQVKDLERKLKASEKIITCLSCEDEKECEYAYDPYNTHGDCLCMK